MSGRILNGDPGSVRPYQVYLQAFNDTGNNMDYGAGVVIAPRVILTVASLIKGYVESKKNILEVDKSVSYSAKNLCHNTSTLSLENE